MGRDDDPTLRLARVIYPVTSLGFGTRVGIWFQGCTIGCAGCMSLDTWDASGGSELRVSNIVAMLDAIPQPFDGVTISGGEPFQQPLGLEALVGRIVDWRGSAPVDVLCYSGYPIEYLTERHSAVISLLDVLIPEPFRPSAGEGATWRGSGNQPLLPLSDLGRERYTDAGEGDGPPPLQIDVSGGVLTVIGVPRHGDLRRLEKQLSAEGISISDVSWRRR